MPRTPRLERLEDRCVLDATFGKLFTTEHVDLSLDYVAGQWDLASEVAGQNFGTDASLHYVAPGALTARPSGSQWDFIGPAGESVYILPQNQNTSLLYLGVAAEGTATNTFAAYTETDARLPDSSQRWITGTVTAVRGPEGGRYSMWQTDAFGTPVPWVSVDIGTPADATDRFFIIEGGHAHYAFGFTKPGDYEIDVRASAYLGANQTNQTTSPTRTYHFHVADSLRVTSVTPTASGFVARLNRPIDLSTLNLYDALGGALGPADVTLVGAATGPVRGSLVVPRVDNRQAVVNGLNAVEFVATGGALAADTYTVTLRSHNVAYSSSNGFKTTASPADTSILAGTFQSSFTVTSSARTLSVADFARGPGQAVNVPITGTSGVPFTLSDGTGVRSVAFTLTWNPALLQLGTASTPLTGWSVTSNIDNAAGRATFTLTGTQAAPAGQSVALRLNASVPSTSAAAIYGSKHVLDISDLVLRDASQAVISSRADDGVHAAVYVGDVTGNGAINAADAAAVASVASSASGFDGTQNLDPRLVGDTSLNGAINAVDASQVARRAAGQSVATVPAPPVVVNSPTGGPDPKITISSATATPGNSLALPVTLDSIVNLSGQDAIVGFRFAITFDPAKLTFTGTTNGVFLARPGWSLTTNATTPGELVLVGYTTTGVTGQFVEEVLKLNFAVAAAASGPTVVNLRQSLGGLNTELNSLNDDALPLIPAPTDAGTDTVDGTVTFLTDPNQPPVNTLPAGPLLVAQGTPTAVSGVRVADPDAGPANVQVTLSVTSGTLAVLTNVSGGLTAAQVSGNGSSSLTLTAPQGTINATLAAASGLRYTPAAAFLGSVTLTMTTNDLGNSGTGGAKSDTDTLAITVAEINDAPVNTLPAGPIGAVEDAATTLLGFSVSDPDAGSASVRVTFTVGGGTLSVNTSLAGGVNAGQVTGNGTGSVVVTAPLAAINATLAGSGLSYTPPLDFTGDVTLTMTTNDLGNSGVGGEKADVDSVVLSVAAGNDPPVNTLPPGPVAVVEDTPKALAGFSIADPDAGGANIRLTLAVTSGQLTLDTSLAVSGNGTGSVVVTAPLAAINAALAAGVLFTPNADFAGDATLTMTTSDLGNAGLGGERTDTDTLVLNVAAVNDAPVNTLPAGALETLPNTPLPLVGLSVADVDAGTSDIRVSLSVTLGTLSLSTIVPGGVTAAQVAGNGTATLTLTAPRAAINATLAETNGLVFEPGGLAGGVTLTMTTSDLGNSGSGGEQTDTDAKNILVAPANQPPTLTVPSGTIQTLAGRPLTFTQAFAVADPDAGTNDIQVSLSTQNGTLLVTPPAGLVASGNGTAAVVLTGPQAAINQALASVTFTPRAGFVGDVSLNANANDLGRSGTGGPRTDSERVVVQVVGVYLNEVSFAAAPLREYVEVRTSVPSFTFPAGTYFVAVEGDAGRPNPGRVDSVFDLSGLTTGSNGFLAILRNGSPLSVPAGAAVARGLIALENDSTTFFLLTAPARPSFLVDIDANNDGRPDGPAWASWRVLDSVSVLDGTSVGDRAYGRITFRRGALGVGGNVVPLPFAPGYVGRVGTSTASTLADWVAARLLGGILDRTSTVPASLRGAAINHVGGPNTFAPTLAGRAANTGAQRSTVTRLVLTFNSVVTIANRPAAFKLVGPSGEVGLSVAVAYAAGLTRVTLLFRPSADTYTLATPFDGGRVALSDGVYTLTTAAAELRNARGQPLAADDVWQLHRYFGDNDGDGDTDIRDRGAFLVALGRRAGQAGYARQFDFDGNGAIDAADQRRFNERFGGRVS